MIKAEFKATCRVYGIKPKALKECLKKEKIKISEATKRDVLNTIFLYAPDLMFSRDVGDGVVEYCYPNIVKDLTTELTRINNEEFDDE